MEEGDGGDFENEVVNLLSRFYGKRILSLLDKNGKRVDAHLTIEDNPQPLVELQSESFNSGPI